jgi:hypothetical protein
MVQLTFTRAVSSASVALIIAMVNDVITDLHIPDGITIMGGCCPTLVKIHSVYLVDTLRYTYVHIR